MEIKKTVREVKYTLELSEAEYNTILASVGACPSNDLRALLARHKIELFENEGTLWRKLMESR